MNGKNIAVTATEQFLQNAEDYGLAMAATAHAGTNRKSAKAEQAI